MTYSTEKEISRGWFVALGILLILTGAAALAFPFVATLSVEVLVGASMFAAGVWTIIQAFSEKQWSGFFWQVAIGVIYLFGGFVLLVAPIGGAIALTLVLGGVFAAEGIARIIMSFQVRPARAWGWVLASGGLSLLLGILVFAGMTTGASLAFIGAIVGINLIFAGSSFIALGVSDEPLPAAQAA